MGETEFTSGIRIIEVRMRNFRSLKKVDVKLDWLSVLIGANNSGKTSFLEALNAAIGAVRHNITIDDIFLDSNEKRPPKDRVVIIDLLIRPIDKQGQILEKLPLGSPWTELWGNGISQDEDVNDFVGIRTIAKWNSTRGEYITERKFLSEWLKDSINIEKAKTNEKITVGARHLEPIALYFMDAKRDILDEMRNRGSFWYKLVSDLDMPENQVKEAEKILNDLNAKIISNSEVLRHVQSHLDELYKTIHCDKGGVSITPLTRNIRDLSKGMDVNFSTSGAQSFPLARHGMGTRSLASILTFKAYSSWRQKKAKGSVHSILAMEEPETHLHPQAQRAMYWQIQDITGQRIISTHSPYLASQADISSFRHFQKVNSETIVSTYDSTLLSSDDLRKINRMVMNTRGEMLFARAIVLFEGETEEQAIPIFAEKFFKYSTISLGITFIGVGGYGSYTPFLRMATAFNIPWYIFSDGQIEAINGVSDCLKRINLKLPLKNVFIIPKNLDFEKYLAIKQYKDVLINMIVEVNATCEKHKQALTQEWSKKTDVLNDIYAELSSNKTKYAAHIARAISCIADVELQVPVLMKQLFEKIKTDLF